MIKLSKGKQIEKYLYTIVGAVLMALSVNLVFEPMGMVTGGVSGLAIVIKKVTESFINGGIPIWLFNILINIPLIIIAIVVKGKKFVLSSIFGTISYIISLYFLPVYSQTFDDPLLASIFGGVLAGLGLGLVISSSSSTGGTDLVAQIIQKFKKHYSVPRILIVIDGMIILLGMLVFGLGNGLYAVIAVFISTKVSDGILEGLKFAKTAHIISDKHEEISKEILKLGRGVTNIQGMGMYSNKNKNILFCVVSRKEMVDVVEITKSIDPNAFVIVSDAREVVGEGFIEYEQ